MTRPRIAAHLIVGAHEEPFLGATLESLSGAVDTLIVNDNSPGSSSHSAVFAASRFAAEGRLEVDRTPFTDFSAARNVCMRLHEQRDAGDWVAFIDADEVHGTEVLGIAKNLASVPAVYDFVDGYTRHYFQSFEWYNAIERRMMFHRFRPGIYWYGEVHEHLFGLGGKRVALPYVYGHYGHTLAPRRHAVKERLYADLGQPGYTLVDDDALDDFDIESYFAPMYTLLMHYAGAHPPAALTTIDRLSQTLRSHHASADRAARALPIATKLRNLVRKANFEQRWRGRALNPLARRLFTPPLP